MNNSEYDVVIIGGGISGTALLYLLSHFTDLPRVALLEKYGQLANVNSHGRNNSQTLHCGDIETNYTLEKALQVQASAKMLVNYGEKVSGTDHILHRYPKMVLSVGERECELLRKRFEQFGPHYPGMALMDAAAIGKIEPKVTEGRTDEICALGLTNEYSAVDFQQLSLSFAEQARQAEGKEVAIHLNSPVQEIRQRQGGYEVVTPSQTLNARFVVVSAGGHSLLFAQRMGYGHEFACLPVAGSFYYTPKLLNGKVYTVQNDKLPFAAIHGDPDLLVDDKTRFGPTALLIPMLERHNFKTVPEFFEVFSFEAGVLKTIAGLFKDPDIRRYMVKNMLYEVPGVRNKLFHTEARKIIPTLKLSDVRFAQRIGGVRPVMINKEKAVMQLGEAKLKGDNIIFNMTPSPGATSCLANGEIDMRTIAEQLGCTIDETRLNATLR